MALVHNGLRLIIAGFISLPVTAQLTERVSVSSGGSQASGSSSAAYYGSISPDGRCVVFRSGAPDLVAGDTNSFFDIFLHDRQNGATEIVSVSSGGVQADADCFWPVISEDARFVAFSSAATTLVATDVNGFSDAFLRDRQTPTTELVSLSSGGVQGNGSSSADSISADGSYVAFTSGASNLVAGDTNNVGDVFVRDRQSGTTEIVSVSSGGTPGNGSSTLARISADGRYVAFQSDATNLVPGDTNGTTDVFVRDRLSATTERASISSGGAQGNDFSVAPVISADGGYVTFTSRASNLVAVDVNGALDVFVRDRLSGTTDLVSLSIGGAQGDADSTFSSISAGGRFVAFHSLATNLVAGDSNGLDDVFLRDRYVGTTEIVSVSSSGAQGNFYSSGGALTNDGRYVAFWSVASTLVAGDTNGQIDTFVRDRAPAGFVIYCEPGAGGVITCPCSNPPSGPGRGCNNSSATGGASLSAAGTAYLSIDNLVFTTSGEKPTATSILLQGTSGLTSGVIYGQGVRCVGGSLLRLFTKHAAAGSITAPDFVAGDPTVSARSAAKGDVIQSGQSRWYLVYYRDPTVLGGCSASSTFNSTQTGRVTWWP